MTYLNSYAKRLLIARALNLGSNFTSKVSYSIHRVVQNAAAAKEIGEYLWEKLAPFQITHLLAPGSGAAPVAAAIGAAALRDGVILETLHFRDPKRLRPDENLIEGMLPTTPVKAAFVDDVLMLGGTFRETIATARAVSPLVDCVAIGVVLDGYFPQGSRALASEGFPIHSVFHRRHLGLTRDSLGKSQSPFSPAIWMRAGLVRKPQFQRKSVPIVTEDEVILGLDDCTVVSFNTADGSKRWTLDSPVKRSKGSSCELLLGEDGTLYSGNYAGILTASRQGEVVWRYGLCLALHSRPTLVDGLLLQNAEDFIEGQPHGRLLCLKAQTGELLWQVPHDNYGPTGVAVADGIAVTANNNAELIGVRLDGTVLWRHKMKAPCRGRALIHSRQVFYVDEWGYLVKICLESGEEVQRVRFSTSSNHSEALLVDGVLVVADHAWHLAGYDPESLERLWVNRLRGPCQWRPAVHKGHLLSQTTEGGLALTVARTGEKLWESRANYRYGTVPMGLSKTHAAILSLDGRLTYHKLEI